MSFPIAAAAAAGDFAVGQANQYINQKYTDYNRQQDQKIYEQNAKLAYGYSKKAAQDSSTAMLTGLKNAGISSATMTGGMNAFPLSSGSAPSTSSPQADNVPISKSMLAGMQTENLKSQNENLQKQTQLLEAQTGKTQAEKTALERENTRKTDEDYTYTKESGHTFGSMKALTDIARQKTAHQGSSLEYMEGEIKAEVLKAYSSDKSNIENEVLHRINTNSKALIELSILNKTLANLSSDTELKGQTLENLKKQAAKISQEIDLSKEQAERLKSLNVKQLIDKGDYIGALLSFVMQITGGLK